MAGLILQTFTALHLIGGQEGNDSASVFIVNR